MILFIDTSARESVIGTIGERRNEMSFAPRSPELVPALRRLARHGEVTKVAVATGPGSFTGLRVGVSFGLGLAMGLRIPIVPLSSFELQSRRADVPVVAVIEAGRGRFYYRLPDGTAGLGDPGEIPKGVALAGRLAPEVQDALRGAGHQVRSEGQLAPEIDAAARLLETAPEVAYGSLELEYMQTFSAGA
ncbi:MAG TPA: tRNA (adenosine(37)-N6)-threonylcarbamoyltransferase complex dimerization subunit type 1 TsaB [Candidatus Dormibacteraeota bacterium]|nr:tRNA (adenosine(37)-N6)-threonylcarbamoyltransferase complex dimerization subunit type 1 TsaB [Candidatus Dormibacteraeota bacterium]